VFFQYVFGRREFARVITAHGFRILETRGTHVLWGLKEMAWFDAAYTRFGSPAAADAPAQARQSPPASSSTSTDRPLRRYLKRAFLEEDARVFPLMLPLRAFAANMMVYVCVAQK
jgi:hypothetical protein